MRLEQFYLVQGGCFALSTGVGDVPAFVHEALPFEEGDGRLRRQYGDRRTSLRFQLLQQGTHQVALQFRPTEARVHQAVAYPAGPIVRNGQAQAAHQCFPVDALERYRVRRTQVPADARGHGVPVRRFQFGEVELDVFQSEGSDGHRWRGEGE